MNMSEVKKLSNNKEVIAYLAEKFPACFSVEGDAKPLKIGIFDDLATRLADDDAVSKTRLRTALRHYTNSWRYLRAMKVGGERVDLDGKVVAKVEKEHQTHAAEALEQSQAAVAERKKAAAKTAKPTAAKRAPTKAAPRKDTKRSKPNSTPTRKPIKQSAPKLQAVTSSQLKPGQQVQVKAGQKPIAGEIVELDRNDVVVQLHNGLTVKVSAEAIFVAQQE